MASWPQEKSNCLIGIGIFSSFMASRNTKVDPSDAQSRLSEELSNPIWNFEYQNCFTMNNALPWKKLWLNDYIICQIPKDSVLWWGRVSSLSISPPYCQKPELQKMSNILLGSIESDHQIILQGLCLLFTSPSENVNHRHPNCEITLNCEWTEYLEFCFTSSWNHLILIVKQACLCYFDVVVKLLEPSWKWLETK